MKEGITNFWVEDGYLIIETLQGRMQKYKIKVEQMEAKK